MFHYYLLWVAVILMGGFLFWLMFYSFYIVLTSKSNLSETDEMYEENHKPTVASGDNPLPVGKTLIFEQRHTTLDADPENKPRGNQPRSKHPRKKAA